VGIFNFGLGILLTALSNERRMILMTVLQFPMMF
jgi:hypothetical protein